MIDSQRKAQFERPAPTAELKVLIGFAPESDLSVIA